MFSAWLLLCKRKKWRDLIPFLLSMIYLLFLVSFSLINRDTVRVSPERFTVQTAQASLWGIFFVIVWINLCGQIMLCKYWISKKFCFWIFLWIFFAIFRMFWYILEGTENFHSFLINFLLAVGGQKPLNFKIWTKLL